MKFGRALPWIAVAVIVAGAIHVVALYAIPRLVMQRVAPQFGLPNVMHIGKRPDASSRGVVRPSTDLLYAVCPYDLSGGHPLVVTASMPQGTYWSVSAYDADTNNYFVTDDRRQQGKVRLLIDPPGGAQFPSSSGAVASPTRRGVVIVRILINGEGHLETLQEAQRSATCGVVH